VGVRFHREHAIAHRHAMLERYPHQAFGAAIGHLLVVAGVAADDAAQRDERGVAAGSGQPRGGLRQLPRAGHADDVHGVRIHAVLGERLARAFDQRIHDARVPAAGKDREAGAGRGTQLAFVMRHGGGRALRRHRETARKFTGWRPGVHHAAVARPGGNGMPTRSRGMLERVPLAALGVLAVAGACWMWSTIPWPDAAGAGRAGLVLRWLGMVALFRLDRAAGLLPALIATDVLLAGALAVALALLPAPGAAVRALRRALLLGALSALYLFQVELLLPADAVAARLGHGLAVGIGTLACVDLMVFMAGYPRRVGLHQLVVVARGQTTEFKVLGGL